MRRLIATRLRLARYRSVRLLGRSLLLLLALAVACLPTTLAADEAPYWEPLPLTGKALHLFTPASGALFAQVDNDLYRSDDAGSAWTAVSLPPPQVPTPNPLSPPPPFRRVVTVDPTNHDVLHASGQDGLYRSDNDGIAWGLSCCRRRRVSGTSSSRQMAMSVTMSR